MSGWWRRDIGKWSRKAGPAIKLPRRRPQSGRPKPCRPCGPVDNRHRIPKSKGFFPPEVIQEDIGPGFPLISPIASRLHPHRIRPLYSQSAGNRKAREKDNSIEAQDCDERLVPAEMEDTLHLDLGDEAASGSLLWRVRVRVRVRTIMKTGRERESGKWTVRSEK